MNEELCESETNGIAVEEPATKTEIEEENFKNDGELTPDSPTPPEEETPPEDSREKEKQDLLCRIAELEQKIEAQNRNSAQKKELRELFPDADPEDLPDSVAEQYEKGVPLAAAYALYKHMQSLERKRAEEQSRKNGRLIHGEIGNSSQNLYYTAEEVRAMSRDQVKMNFQSILDSMRHW